MNTMVTFRLLCEVCGRTLIDGKQPDTKKLPSLMKKLVANPFPHLCKDANPLGSLGYLTISLGDPSKVG